MDLAKKDAVDPNTIFFLASMSKAFTACAVGLLVDDGKLDWNDPVVEHLP
ncbi:MAG: beta-lactamase family protein, partial [Flavobacteriales bacterium]|nr:beta-lactamase family protein [Flavobacteriales bacterium]